MSALSEADLRSIKHRSHRAASITGFGTLLMLGAIAYSAWTLTNLQTAISQKRSELTKVKEELGAEARSLEDQVTALRTQKDELQASLDEINSVIAAKKVTALTNTVQKLTPVSAVVKPRAKAAPLPGRVMGDGKQLYEFTLWLEVPPDRLSQIRSVTYEFNHPTFRLKQQTSTDATNGFPVSYRGWGCLRRVIITLMLSDGTTQPMDFDMCGALQW